MGRLFLYARAQWGRTSAAVKGAFYSHLAWARRGEIFYATLPRVGPWIDDGDAAGPLLERPAGRAMNLELTAGDEVLIATPWESFETAADVRITRAAWGLRGIVMRVIDRDNPGAWDDPQPGSYASNRMMSARAHRRIDKRLACGLPQQLKGRTPIGWRVEGTGNVASYVVSPSSREDALAVARRFSDLRAVGFSASAAREKIASESWRFCGKPVRTPAFVRAIVNAVKQGFPLYNGSHEPRMPPIADILRHAAQQVAQDD